LLACFRDALDCVDEISAISISLGSFSSGIAPGSLDILGLDKQKGELTTPTLPSASS